VCYTSVDFLRHSVHTYQTITLFLITPSHSVNSANNYCRFEHESYKINPCVHICCQSLISPVLQQSASSAAGIGQRDARYVECFQWPCQQPVPVHHLPVESFSKSGNVSNTSQRLRTKMTRYSRTCMHANYSAATNLCYKISYNTMWALGL